MNLFLGRFRPSSFTASLLCLVVVVIGCGGDDPTGPDGGDGTPGPPTLAWTFSDSETEAHLNRAFAPGEEGLAFACGHGGVVLKTTDHGDNWAVLHVGAPSLLRGIDFLDADTGIFAGEGGAVFLTSDGGASFADIGTGTGTRFWDAAMADASTIVAVGDGGTFYRTTDGGENWTPITETGRNYLAADFADADNGLIVGADSPIAGVARTTDGGATWEQVASTPERAADAHMLDANRAFVVGANGMIARTEDGGDTWTSIDSGTDDTLRAISFVDDLVGIAAGASSVLLTNDGGATWTRQTFEPATSVWGAGMTGAGRALTVGASGIAYRGLRGDPSDETPPAIDVFDPTDGSTDFELMADMYVGFSEVIDATTVNPSSIYLSGPGGTVDCGFDLGARGMWVNPLDGLEPQTQYTFTVTQAVADLSGNTLASTFTSSFTTGSGERGVVQKPSRTETALFGEAP